MKPIHKNKNPGFRFLSTPKKSLPKSLTQKKSLQNFKPKKSPQIANFKPNKGLRTSPSLIYLSTLPGIIIFSPPQRLTLYEAYSNNKNGLCRSSLLCSRFWDISKGETSFNDFPKMAAKETTVGERGHGENFPFVAIVQRWLLLMRGDC